VGPEYKCREELHEFVDQKRQIFQVQLFTDRKKKEIERIEQQARTESDFITTQASKLIDFENTCRLNRNQAEGEMGRAKRAMDRAIRRRGDLSAELRRKRAAVDALESDVFTMEERVESLRKFDQFLCRFDDSMTRTMLYQNPSLLLDEIALLETENLRLFERCDELGSERERTMQTLNRGIAEAEQESAEIHTRGQRLPAVELIDMRALQVARDTENADRVLAMLTRLVDTYFHNCFKKSADIGALMMLERMEVELETMYTTVAKLSPQYLMEKQTAIDRSRREEQRRQKQAAHALEQQRKMKASLERSVMPIHMRVGRPLMPRMWPENTTKKDTSRKEQDGQIQDQLLFGDVQM
jgi:hypothetical protein